MGGAGGEKWIGGDREKLTRAINKRGRECLLKKLTMYSILGDRDQ